MRMYKLGLIAILAISISGCDGDDGTRGSVK